MHEEDKQGILDVRILMNNLVEIDIEIQVAEFPRWADHSLFYVAKMYTEQIKKGQPYDVLKKCVSISILDFTLFHDSDEFYSCFHILEDTRHTLYTDKIEFHVVELSKLPEELKEDSNDILLWAKFINAEQKEEFTMLASKNKYIQSAYEQLQIISQDDKKRMEYEAREKAIRDYNYLISSAEKKGRLEGHQEGKLDGKLEVAAELYHKGWKIPDISNLIGISVEVLNQRMFIKQ